MAEIVFVRIDDRLLHGQVARSWVKEEGANLIVVANDRVAEDRDTQKLMNIATPLYADSRFLSVENLIEKIKDDHDGKKVLILVEGPEDALRLLDAGLDINEINVGNMRELPGKEKVIDDVFVDAEDRANFKKIHDKGVKLDLRILSSDAPSDENLLF